MAHMSRIRRILVAVKDPMAVALPAVVKATQLARALDADLELFHAIDCPVYMDTAGCAEERALQTEEEARAVYLQRLERIAARLRLHTPRVTVAAGWDHPGYEAIIRRAEASGADLIVAECHAGSHLASGVRKLSDWELVRLSPVPVLLVRLPRPYQHPTILTALDPSHAFAKPAALDEALLQLGTLLTDALRGTLHAVHTYAPTGAGDLAGATAWGLPVPETGALEARRRLDRLLAGQDILPLHRHLVAGSPDDGIVTLARRLPAQLVVAGSTSRAGLQGLLIGNTSERLLASLPCDLLVVKPTPFADRVPLASQGARLVTMLPAY
jgi:universal stress protein E